MKKSFYLFFVGILSLAFSNSVLAQNNNKATRPAPVSETPNAKMKSDATTKPVAERPVKKEQKVKKMEVNQPTKATKNANQSTKVKKEEQKSPEVKVGETKNKEVKDTNKKVRPKIEGPKTHKLGTTNNDQ